MLKKLFIILLLAVISVSIYTVFVNLSSNWQYNQDMKALENNYALSENVSIADINSSRIPSPLANYLRFSQANRSKLPVYVKLNYSGKYRADSYSEFNDFRVKSFYSVKNGHYVSEWMIDNNRIIFEKIKEKLTDRDSIYDRSLLGIRNIDGSSNQNTAFYLNSRIMIDAAYFPYYYLSTNCSDWTYLGPRRVRVTANTEAGPLNFDMNFNDNDSLNSINSESFTFLGDTVRLTASYDNYVSRNNFRVPSSIQVVCERNFSEFVLYEATLDNINYR